MDSVMSVYKPHGGHSCGHDHGPGGHDHGHGHEGHDHGAGGHSHGHDHGAKAHDHGAHSHGGKPCTGHHGEEKSDNAIQRASMVSIEE